MARASAGFAPAGMLSASTLPPSIRSASGGSLRRSPGMGRAGGILVAVRSRRGIATSRYRTAAGRTRPATSGWSKSERKTLIPSTIEVRSLASSAIQSLQVPPRSTASTCSAELAARAAPSASSVHSTFSSASRFRRSASRRHAALAGAGHRLPTPTSPSASLCAIRSLRAMTARSGHTRSPSPWPRRSCRRTTPRPRCSGRCPGA